MRPLNPTTVTLASPTPLALVSALMLVACEEPREYGAIIVTGDTSIVMEDADREASYVHATCGSSTEPAPRTDIRLEARHGILEIAPQRNDCTVFVHSDVRTIRVRDHGSLDVTLAPGADLDAITVPRQHLTLRTRGYGEAVVNGLSAASVAIDAGGSSASYFGRVEAPEVWIEAAGDADVTLDQLDAHAWMVDLRGSSHVRAAGEVTLTELDLRGATQLEAEEVVTTEVTGTIRGSANAAITVLGDVDVDLVGAGSLDL